MWRLNFLVSITLGLVIPPEIFLYLRRLSPETWQETIAILGSDRVSEAARRLAISLMFGAYVLRSDLSADSDQISRKYAGFIPRTM